MMIDFVKHDSAADLKASYEVALTLPKHGKIFWHGKIIKKFAIKMALLLVTKTSQKI